MIPYILGLGLKSMFINLYMNDTLYPWSRSYMFIKFRIINLVSRKKYYCTLLHSTKNSIIYLAWTRQKCFQSSEFCI